LQIIESFPPFGEKLQKDQLEAFQNLPVVVMLSRRIKNKSKKKIRNLLPSSINNKSRR